MGTQTRIDTVLQVIERRVAEISARQHALAVEKARLVEQMTPLRLGVTPPDLALAQLRSKGIALRGADRVRASDRRPSGALLKSVVPLRRNVTTPAPAHSETA